VNRFSFQLLTQENKEGFLNQQLNTNFSLLQPLQFDQICKLVFFRHLKIAHFSEVSEKQKISLKQFGQIEKAAILA
jgi:hypothetical protein